MVSTLNTTTDSKSNVLQLYAHTSQYDNRYRGTFKINDLYAVLEHDREIST